MIPRHNDYSGSIRTEESFSESAEKVASLAILSGHVGVRIGGVGSCALDQVAAHDDQVRRWNPFRVPSRSIADERGKKLIVPEMGFGGSM